ncbi:ABC transporter ATP-binding protein [Chromatiales bacterium (ex Bugula neritina AB1)]|nr:ABC transporter ATP-binding protein [Chromatiales bacterium (ex Bugula neritina AB1)]
MVAIALENLSKRFGDFTALSQVSLNVEPEEFLTLLGPSGCGKTTLLKLVSGFLEPSEGRIVIGGQDVTRIPPEGRDTALCFQSYALFPHLSVRENLEFGPRQKRLSRGDRESRVDDVATKLDLTAQMSKLPNELSGGQQQRVSLGRALVMRPSVILFDEPLSNLDAKLRDQVRVEIRRIQKEYGLTAIYVTHDQAEALAMSDRIVVMNNGMVEQVDTPEVLYAKPKTKFVADFIGDANVLHGSVVGESTVGIWRIKTALGAVDIQSSVAPQSKQVDLCWRPEHAIISANGIAGTVVHRAFQGHFTNLIINTNEEIYRVQANHTLAQEGDVIHISIPPDKFVLLESPA